MGGTSETCPSAGWRINRGSNPHQNLIQYLIFSLFIVLFYKNDYIIIVLND